ncbi:unnamed protein product, partial [Phaeothamnion confervicola]
AALGPSPLFVANVEHFGRSGGFAALLVRIDPDRWSADSARIRFGGGGSGAGRGDGNPVSIAELAALLSFLRNVAPVLARDFAESFGTRLRDAAFSRLGRLADDELKQLEDMASGGCREGTLLDALQQLERLLPLLLRAHDADAAAEGYQLSLALQLLRRPSFSMRARGVAILSEAVDVAARAAAAASSTAAYFRGNSGGGVNASNSSGGAYSNSGDNGGAATKGNGWVGPGLRWSDGAALAEWLEVNEVLHVLLGSNPPDRSVQQQKPMPPPGSPFVSPALPPPGSPTAALVTAAEAATVVAATSISSAAPLPPPSPSPPQTPPSMSMPMQPEVLKRCEGLFCFMAGRGLFRRCHLDALWRAAGGPMTAATGKVAVAAVNGAAAAGATTPDAAAAAGPMPGAVAAAAMSSPHAPIVYRLIAQLVPHLDAAGITAVYEKLRTLSPGYTMAQVELIKAFVAGAAAAATAAARTAATPATAQPGSPANVRAASPPNAGANNGRVTAAAAGGTAGAVVSVFGSGLELLWKAMQESAPVAPDVADAALCALADLLAAPTAGQRHFGSFSSFGSGDNGGLSAASTGFQREEQLTFLLDMCVENVARGISVVLTLRLVQRLADGQPDTMGGRGAGGGVGGTAWPRGGILRDRLLMDLERESGILQLTVSGLVAYRKDAARALNSLATDPADAEAAAAAAGLPASDALMGATLAGRFPHGEAMQAQLDFLRFVGEHSPAQLTFRHFAQLWRSFFVAEPGPLCAAESEMFFRWLRRLAPEMNSTYGRQSTYMVTSEETAAQVFSRLLCSGDGPSVNAVTADAVAAPAGQPNELHADDGVGASGSGAGGSGGSSGAVANSGGLVVAVSGSGGGLFANMGDEGYGCLEWFFRFANWRTACIGSPEHKLYMSVQNFDGLRGVDLLWQVLWQTQSERVVQAAMDFLVVLHCRLREGLDRRAAWLRFVARCMAVISTHAAPANAAAAAVAVAAAPQAARAALAGAAAAPAEELLVRATALLSRLLDAVGAGDAPPPLQPDKDLSLWAVVGAGGDGGGALSPSPPPTVTAEVEAAAAQIGVWYTGRGRSRPHELLCDTDHYFELVFRVLEQPHDWPAARAGAWGLLVRLPDNPRVRAELESLGGRVSAVAAAACVSGSEAGAGRGGGGDAGESGGSGGSSGSGTPASDSDDGGLDDENAAAAISTGAGFAGSGSRGGGGGGSNGGSGNDGSGGGEVGGVKAEAPVVPWEQLLPGNSAARLLYRLKMLEPLLDEPSAEPLRVLDTCIMGPQDPFVAVAESGHRDAKSVAAAAAAASAAAAAGADQLRTVFVHGGGLQRLLQLLAADGPPQSDFAAHPLRALCAAALLRTVRNLLAPADGGVGSGARVATTEIMDSSEEEDDDGAGAIVDAVTLPEDALDILSDAALYPGRIPVVEGVAMAALVAGTEVAEDASRGGCTSAAAAAAAGAAAARPMPEQLREWCPSVDWAQLVEKILELMHAVAESSAGCGSGGHGGAAGGEAAVWAVLAGDAADMSTVAAAAFPAAAELMRHSTALLTALTTLWPPLLDAVLQFPSLPACLEFGLVRTPEAAVRREVAAGVLRMATELGGEAERRRAARLFAETLLAALPSPGDDDAGGSSDAVSSGGSSGGGGGGVSYCGEYFGLLAELVRLPGGIPEDTTGLCLELAAFLARRPVMETSEDECDPALGGCMLLLHTVLTALPSGQRSNVKLALGTAGLPRELFDRCLFAPPPLPLSGGGDAPGAKTGRSGSSGCCSGGAGEAAMAAEAAAAAAGRPRPPKCKHAESRRLAFLLLQEAIDDCLGNLACVLALALPHHHLGLTLEEQERRRAREVRRTSHHNLLGPAPGAMALAAAAATHGTTHGSSWAGMNGAAAGDGSASLLHVSSFGVQPKHMSKHPSGYIGLKNPGCICYMNSTMQQLFMIPGFRSDVLAFGGPAGAVGYSGASGAAIESSAGGRGHDSVGTAASGASEAALARASSSTAGALAGESGESGGGGGGDDDGHASLMWQLQRMFGHLQESDKAHFSPRGFCEALRGWDGAATDVNVQQDASEFLALLFQRLEASVQGTVGEDMLRRSFGGVLNHVLAADAGGGGSGGGGGGRGGQRLRSERAEPFTFVSVKVKDMHSLEKSLELYVRGETVEYAWEEPAKAATAATGASADSGGGDGKAAAAGGTTRLSLPTCKRVSFAALPRHLLLHLQRFEFDFHTMQQNKVNDRFQFPTTLDMFPYTEEGLAQQAAADGANVDASGDSAAAGADDAGAAAATIAMTAAPATRAAGGEDGIPERLRREDCLYQLAGVVVHMGTANNGHYYSYCRERGGARRWFEFNDSVVAAFDPSNLEAECFGGLDADGGPAAAASAAAAAHHLLGNRGGAHCGGGGAHGGYGSQYEHWRSSSMHGGGYGAEVSGAGGHHHRLPVRALKWGGARARNAFLLVYDRVDGGDGSGNSGGGRVGAVSPPVLGARVPDPICREIRLENLEFFRKRWVFEPGYYDFLEGLLAESAVAAAAAAAAAAREALIADAVQLGAQFALGTLVQARESALVAAAGRRLLQLLELRPRRCDRLLTALAADPATVRDVLLEGSE